MSKKTTKCLSVLAVLVLAFTMLLTAFALSAGSGRVRASAEGEQGKLLYVVDCGRVNNQNGTQLEYGYDPTQETPTYINETKTFIKREGGNLGDKQGDDAKGLTLLENSYTDRPFGADPRTGKYWGFNEDYTNDMPHRLGKGGNISAGFSEFRSVNDPNDSTVNETLVYKFEVLDGSALDVTVITCTPDETKTNNVAWNTVDGKMSVNDGTALPLISRVAVKEGEDWVGTRHSVPDCKGVLNAADEKYYLTLTFGVDGAHTVVNGIIIREKPFDVTYNLNGGTNNTSNKATYVSGTGFTLAAPTRAGYTFDGWYDAETGGTKVTEISATQMGAITLYARWTAATEPEPENPSTEPEKPSNGGCNSSIGSTISLFSGLAVLSAGAIVVKCKKKN